MWTALFNFVFQINMFQFLILTLIYFSPITYAWEGGVLLSQDPEFPKMIVTRKQFEEHRLSFCLDKFDV